MTIQAATVAPTQTPYVFWLATWHNLPIPLGQPRCCRITRATLEIDLTPTTCWSIPLSAIVACERYVHHDGITGLYLYAQVTVQMPAAAAGVPAKEEIFLGAMDPISQSWDWQETINLITLLNQLCQSHATAIHTNPYYRALERRSRVSDFTQMVSSWDVSMPPTHYEHHPLMQEIRQHATRTIGFPMLLGLLCVVVTALLFWFEASHWLMASSALGILPLALAGFWSSATYRRFKHSVRRFVHNNFSVKEIRSKSAF